MFAKARMMASILALGPLAHAVEQRGLQIVVIESRDVWVCVEHKACMARRTLIGCDGSRARLTACLSKNRLSHYGKVIATQNDGTCPPLVREVRAIARGTWATHGLHWRHCP